MFKIDIKQIHVKYNYTFSIKIMTVTIIFFWSDNFIILRLKNP